VALRFAVPDHESTPSETPENITEFAAILSAAKTLGGLASNGRRAADRVVSGELTRRDSTRRRSEETD